MQQTAQKTPVHLWWVGGFATLFNAIGVFDFVMTQWQGSAYLLSAGMTPEQVAHYAQMPGMMTVVWAVGVFAAFGASLLLLLRRKAAAPAFWLSLAAFGLNMAYTYVFTDGGTIMGAQMAWTSAFIAAVLLLLGVYARAMARRHVLRG